MRITIALFVVSVLQCFVSEAHATSVLQNYLHKSPQGYALEVPQGFTYSEYAPSGDYYYFGYANTSIFGQTSVELYDNVADCSHSTLGNREVDINTIANVGDKTQWTFVPIFNYNDWFPDVICPAARGECTDKEYASGKCDTNAATYAFCSQNDNKIVFICLEQQQNNPELAQLIFSSFRWLDQENTPAIQYLLDHKIASGYPDGTFKPERTINRAEFTKIIVGAVHDAAKINECPARSSVLPFPDVSAEDWFMPYTCTARRFGIMGGYPDGTFRPAQLVNTAEAAKIVTGAFGLSIEKSASGPWYRPYIDALLALDALPSSAQDPAHLLTRGEMAGLIYNILQHDPRR